MRIFKKILSLTIAVIMVTGVCCVTASAKTVESSSVPYDTYMYDYNGNPIITPHAYIPSSTFTGADLGIGDFTNPQDIEVDTDDARLLAITVPGEGGIFARGRDIKIPWACIEHIGDDLIIVNMKNLTPRN